jgi:PAS domain S-box-containing protein
MSDISKLRILFVEDLPSDVDLAVIELKREHLLFDHITVCTKEELLTALKDFRPDLIISDYMMPSYDGMRALHDVMEFDRELPFILFTGSINEETAVKCIKAGAVDYVIKEHMTRLPFAVKEALEQVSIKREKRASELLLKDSEEKIQSIFRAAPVGIGLVVRRVFIEVNDTFCKMTGYTRDELIGKNSEMIYPSREEYEFIGTEKYKQISNFGTGSIETRFKKKDGSIINILMSSTPLDINDLLKGVTFTALDISDKMKRENDLRKLSRAVEQNPVSILITNTEGIIEYANQKMCEVTGYSINELIGKNPSVLSSKSKSQEEYKVLWDSIKRGDDWKGEFLNKRKNGELYWESALISPIKNEKEEITHFLGIKEDITLRKLLEESTRESEKRYRELFLNNPIPTYIFDEETLGFVEVNDAAVENYGYSKEEFAKMTLRDLRIKEEIPELIESLTKIGKETFHSTRMRHMKKDGTLFPVEITSHSLPEKNGRKTRLVVVNDITERLKAAEQMIIAREKAEASDRIKTNFLNNISHEVRTPLNGILGFAEIMNQPGLTEEERKESFSMLFQSSDRLLNTITSYMDISLLTSGALSVSKKDFCPAQMLSNLFEVNQSLCSQKKLQLFLNIPAGGEKLIVHSDPEVLRKIFGHLLDNAVKFTEKGDIHFGFTNSISEIRYFVRDTGIGIQKDSLVQIFDKFVKEDRGPQRISEGSGLGLSIAKGLTEILGGIITVESEPGAGSCFTLSFSLIPDTGALSGNTPDRQKSQGIDNYTILIAEDDDTNFFYLNAILSREFGSKILHAENGREAIDLFKENPDIRLVLMDIKMPEIDGIEATRQIKIIRSEVPVIAITAYAMSGDEERVMAAGCDGYLSKPISKEKLLRKIAEFVK